MNRSLFVLAALMTVVATAAGQIAVVDNSLTAASTAPKVSPGLQQRNSRYQLRRGDTFDLDFALSPEFNQTVAVEPDGYVTLKGAGSFFVEGQTVPELTES